jgi:DNA ligase-1
LDGELFIGKGKYNQLAGILSKKNTSEEDWLKITFCVFDAPNLKMQFIQRYSVASR